jgi:hypothetical protein
MLSPSRCWDFSKVWNSGEKVEGEYVLDIGRNVHFCEVLSIMQPMADNHRA